MVTLTFWIKCFLSLAAVAVAAITVVRMNGNKSKQPTEVTKEKNKYMYNSILLVGILFWPILFDASIGLQHLITKPRLMFGFFWVPLIMCVNMAFVQYDADASFQHSELHRDTSSIISAAFAMGSLFYAGSKNYSSTHLLLYAMLLCIAFIVPTITVPSNTQQATLVRSVQKVTLNYAVGFVICAISVDLLKNVFAEQQ